ncbi:MAG TPA: DUF2141 domain-containing protein [Hellea balneolensis]|uniref:DUF2141 domain-containing protein n=1 Tax=Hellea balneolensis TaxID=287478 RepID=A0A7C5QRG3_9PROT|nr:DUF2141 domain-containing protein [Hellea balneolensis]
MFVPAAAASGETDGQARIHPTLEIYANEAADPCDPTKTQVRMTVVGIKKGGILTLELYNDPKHFLSKKGRVRRVRVPAEDGPQTVCMTENNTGSYAVAGYHDIDGNRKLKKKWNGTPREPFALSNNPKIKELRFPKFSESAFDLVPGGTNITLELVDLKKQKELRKAERRRSK